MKTRFLVIGIAVAAIAAAIAISTSGGGSTKTAAPVAKAASSAASAVDQERQREQAAGKREPKEPVHERSTPGGHVAAAAAEQTADRAYPKPYVETSRALAASAAYNGAPDHLNASDFNGQSGPNGARRGSVHTLWKELGPYTPSVPGAVTYTGAPSMDSGRVTALAVDPTCGQNGRCRVWVAAAGGGVWRTEDGTAAHPTWVGSSSGIASRAVGSIVVDPTDPSGNTLYVGTGEPNGSTDSEAGVGLYRSTDGGQHWSWVEGAYPVSHDRSIGSIAVDPTNARHIYIGTDLARHGMASTYGGRRTPPGAPTLGLYESTDGGQSFKLVFSRPGSPNPPATGADFFQGGVHQIALDPAQPATVYLSMFGYGIWRRSPALDGNSAFHQVFVTRNPSDTFGDRTAFAITRSKGHTRMYVGDSSDDDAISILYRNDHADQPAAALVAAGANTAAWHQLSNPTNGTPGYTSYNYCEGQCGYDDPVSVDPTNPDIVWLGGQMAYGEIPGAEGGTPRSNGRAVVRSTNAGVSFTDMTQDVGTPKPNGLHPDIHAIVFTPTAPVRAFIGSDGGVTRIGDTFVDHSSVCSSRGLAPADLQDCRRFLAAIPTHIAQLNDGLRTLQFQGVTANPQHPLTDVIGGTQDNGTWAYSGSPTWMESIGGDGGPSAIDVTTGVRQHTYTGTTGDVNFHGSDPNTWDYNTQPMDFSNEASAFYSPLIADPRISGTMFAGMQHVWRTKDNGGNQAQLDAHCYDRNPLGNLPSGDHTIVCGDWVALGADLTDPSFGDRAGQYVVQLARAPSDHSTLWAATRTGRLFVSANADAADPTKVTFHRVDTASTPGRFISGITVDPTNPNHAWVSYSGYDAYTPSTPGHVFDVRYDPGTKKATFTNMSANIGDQPVTDVVFDQATGDLYVSTDFGVLRRASESRRWHRVNGGLPPVAVYDLVIPRGGRVLYAATHGRGIYRLDLQDPHNNNN
ncbi:MAG: hypothetical protein JWN46_811 [Acidimicrobiales bacterium]|nr:hypothetical protein [Acidimicrobiales bacterium]